MHDLCVYWIWPADVCHNYVLPANLPFVFSEYICPVACEFYVRVMCHATSVSWLVSRQLYVADANQLWVCCDCCDWPLCICVARPIRVRAQRKFASSSSVASSPCGSVMYNRAVSSPSDWSTVDQSPLPAVRKLLAGRRVTTDDFLTFLCLRGLTLTLNRRFLICVPDSGWTSSRNVVFVQLLCVSCD